MAINSRLPILCLAGLALGAGAGAGAGAATREAASPAACQSAATEPPIATAKATLDAAPTDLRARFALADAWSDAGCFGESLHVLQRAVALHQSSTELTTRLRVARSLVGEEQFFDELGRADDEAELKHDTFRCTTLGDREACAAARRSRPDDAALAAAAPGEPARHTEDAPAAAAPPAPPAAAALPPAARYSNAAPETRSH